MIVDVSVTINQLEILFINYSFRIRLYVIAYLKVTKIKDNSILFLRNKAFLR